MDGYDYIVFASSETMRCFECGQEGHVRRVCLERIDDVTVVDGGGVTVGKQLQDNVRNGEESTDQGVEQLKDTEIEEIEERGGEDICANSSNVVEAVETVLEGERIGSEVENEEELLLLKGKATVKHGKS